MISKTILAAVLAAGLSAVGVAMAAGPAQAEDWSPLWSTTTLSQGRSTLAVTSADGKVFFGGGAGNSDVVDIFDADTLTRTTTSLSQGRNLLAATSAGGKVFFGGGQWYSGDSVQSDVVDIFDVATLAHTTAGLSQARSHLAATSAGGKVFFAGGSSDSGVSDVVDIYDTTSGTWSTARLSQARTGLAAAAAGNRVFFGGGSGFSDVVDIYTFQNYGTITSSKAWTLVDNTSVAGRMQLNGGSLSLGSYSLAVGSMSGSAPINLGSQTITAGSDGTISTYSGAISGHGGIIKTGGGMLILSKTSSYDGTTRVSGGTLMVTGSIAASSALIDGGTLLGTGTVGDTMGTSGHLHPGASGSPGIFRSGSLEMSQGFNFDVNLNGTVPGTGYSQLDVTGTVDLGGATLDAALGYAPAWYTGGGPPDLLYIIKNDADDPVTGQFAGLPQMSEFNLLYDGTPYQALISYQGDYDAKTLTGGNDVVLALPEPATLSLLALGGLLAMRRRRGK